MKALLPGAAMALLLSALPVLADTDCNDAEDTAAMLACHDEAWTAARKRTDERQDRLAGHIVRHDETWAGDGPDGAARLAASHSAWESSRNADCELAGFAMAGGSMEAVITLACLTERQNARNDWLDGRIAQFMPWD